MTIKQIIKSIFSETVNSFVSVKHYSKVIHKPVWKNLIFSFFSFTWITFLLIWIIWQKNADWLKTQTFYWTEKSINSLPADLEIVLTPEQILFSPRPYYLYNLTDFLTSYQKNDQQLSGLLILANTNLNPEDWLTSEATKSAELSNLNWEKQDFAIFVNNHAIFDKQATGSTQILNIRELINNRLSESNFRINKIILLNNLENIQKIIQDSILPLIQFLVLTILPSFLIVSTIISGLWLSIGMYIFVKISKWSLSWWQVLSLAMRLNILILTTELLSFLIYGLVESRIYLMISSAIIIFVLYTNREDFSAHR